MARNEEKAFTLFNKWQTFKKDFHSTVANKRPLYATDCDSLPQAEQYRRDLIKDITRKISAIHNASLGEHRIREMNDEINKMMRTKHFWETRIRELGGDVMRGRQFYDVEGKELPGAPGYKYYGAAKDLPGVRELFAEKDEETEQRKQKKSRSDLYRFVTPDYYGYRDDDDGILKIKELERESELLNVEKDAFLNKKRALLRDIRLSKRELSPEELLLLEENSDEEEELALAAIPPPEDDVDNIGDSSSSISNNVSGVRGSSAESDANIRSHVALPSQQEINAAIVEQKKKMLMERLTIL